MAKSQDSISDKIRSKLSLLLERHRYLESEKRKSDEQVKELKEEVKRLNSIIELKEKQYRTLKTVKLLSATDEERKDSYATLVKLVRDIDKCISMLNE